MDDIENFGTKGDKRSENDFNYEVPDWFLNYNVKTAAELATADIDLELLTDDDDDKDILENTKCQVTSRAYEGLYDLTRGALMKKQPSILLQTPHQEHVPNLTSVVELLAKDLDAALITIDMQDLEDLAIDFCGQNGHAIDLRAGRYLSGGSERLLQEIFKPMGNATRAIIRSVVKKSAGSMKRAKKKKSALPLLFFHIVDCSRGADIIEAFRATLQEGQAQLIETALVFASIQSTRAGHETLYSTAGDLHRKLSVVDRTWIQDIVLHYPAPGKDLKARRDQELVVRRVKRDLRKRLDKDLASSEHLAPQPPWNYPKLMDSTPISMDFVNEESTLNRISIEITVRTEGKDQLELDDLCEVISRLGDNRREATEWKSKDGGANHPKKTPKVSGFMKKLEKITKSCSAFEQKLMDRVVDPAELRVTLDDVIVDEEVKIIMRQLMSMSNFSPKKISHRLLDTVRITGALLYGPPGTGKTHLARAVAKEFGTNFIAVSSADITSKWVGETDKYIQATFALATKLSPCVLFIDEVDSLFARRSSSNKSWERSAINQFLMEMDGLATGKDAPFVLVATNRPMDLDEAFLRRVPQKVLFGLPNEEQRAQILQTFLSEEDLGSSLTFEDIARRTRGFSGSDIRTLCGQAALIFQGEQVHMQMKLGEDAALDRLILERRHFERALARTQPSVSQRSVDEVERFARTFNTQLSNLGIDTTYEGDDTLNLLIKQNELKETEVKISSMYCEKSCTEMIKETPFTK